MAIGGDGVGGRGVEWGRWEVSGVGWVEGEWSWVGGEWSLVGGRGV